MEEDNYEVVHLGFWTDDETIHVWKLTHNPMKVEAWRLLNQVIRAVRWLKIGTRSFI